VKPVESEPKEPGVNSFTDGNLMQEALRRFRRAPLLVTVELGRGKLNIRNLLELGYHSLVPVNRPAGSNLDIRVNGCLLGKGEPVIYENKVGIKIETIVDGDD
jgi:flagellar motor switch protein FliN